MTDGEKDGRMHSIIHILYKDEDQFFMDHYAHEFPGFLYHHHRSKDDDYLNLIDVIDLEKMNSDRYDWIGILSVDALEKIQSSKLHDFFYQVEHDRTEDMDVAVFYNPYPNESLIDHLSRYSPGLLEIIQELLIVMGEDEKDVMASMANATGFYGNLWIARKEILQAYCVWIKIAQKVLKTMRQDKYLTGFLECAASIFFHRQKYCVKMMETRFEKKSAIYVLYHDEPSYQVARTNYSRIFPRFLYHKLIESPLLESSFYLQDFTTIKEADWVGTLTYRAITSKISIQALYHFEDILQMEDDLDVVVFFNPFPEETLKEQMIRCHPGLYEIFKAVLIAMEEDATLLDSSAMIPFYSNLWIAKKHITLAYAEWMKKAWKTIQASPSLTEAIQCSSSYPHWNNNPTLLWRLFRLPYMPQHPFLFERLPCFFFYSRQYRIHMI